MDLIRYSTALFFGYYGAQKFIGGLSGIADMLQPHFGISLAMPMAIGVAAGEVGSAIALIQNNTTIMAYGFLVLAIIMMGAMVIAHPIWDPDQMMTGFVRILMTIYYFSFYRMLI